MKAFAAFSTLILAAGAVGGPATPCSDALCLNFRQVVPPSHCHLHRDTDAACVNFQQYVPANHRHVHRNRDVTSPHFLEYVPPKRPRTR